MVMVVAKEEGMLEAELTGNWPLFFLSVRLFRGKKAAFVCIVPAKFGGCFPVGHERKVET